MADFQEFLDPKNWVYFTELVQITPPDTQFLTKLLIGDINVKSGNMKVRTSPERSIVYDVEHFERPLAPLRGYYSEPIEVSRLTNREQKTAPIVSIPLRDYIPIELFDRFVPAPALNVQSSTKIKNDMWKREIIMAQSGMMKMVTRRVEAMLGQIIASGKVTYDDGQFSVSHDFELNPSCFISATASLPGAKAWNAADAEPVTDLREMRLRFSKMNAGGPAIILVGSDVAEAILYKSTITNKMNFLRADYGNIKPKFADEKQVEYLMTLQGIGELYHYYGMYDEAGVAKDYLDPKKVYFISGDWFRLYYGAIASTLLNGIAEMDFFSYTEASKSKKGYDVVLETKPFPVVVHPNSIMSFKVL